MFFFFSVFVRFVYISRWARCNSKEDFYEMGQQTSEKGNFTHTQIKYNKSNDTSGQNKKNVKPIVIFFSWFLSCRYGRQFSILIGECE